MSGMYLSTRSLLSASLNFWNDLKYKTLRKGDVFIIRIPKGFYFSESNKHVVLLD